MLSMKKDEFVPNKTLSERHCTFKKKSRRFEFELYGEINKLRKKSSKCSMTQFFMRYKKSYSTFATSSVLTEIIFY